MASLSDMTMVRHTRVAARALYEADPELKRYPLLKKQIATSDAPIHLE